MDSGGNKHAPQAGDRLYLDPSAGAKGAANPTNVDSIADITVAVDAVYIDPSYTKNITSEADLTVRSALTYEPTQGQWFAAVAPGPNPYKIRVDPLLGAATVTLGGNADISTDLVFEQGVTTTIDSNPQKEFRGAIENNGVMKWLNGDISLHNALTNNGTFDI